MKKTKLDDGFHSYLVEGVDLVGNPGIPQLLNLHNTSTPTSLIPFEKCKHTDNHRQYVHFYMHDKYFSDVITSAWKYIDLFKQFDGIITPDCSMLIGQAPCLQQTNTYFNRAVGAYYQSYGIPVIPNIRWSDERSYPYCFLGVPSNILVAVSTHGCIHSNEQKTIFRNGLEEMLNRLHPSEVIVHGHMPQSVFGEFVNDLPFQRFPSQFELTHEKEDC